MQIRADGRDVGPADSAGPVNRAAILAELEALYTTPGPVADDEVTLVDLAGLWACERSTARARADALVRKGVLARREARTPSGKYCWAYKLASPACKA